MKAAAGALTTSAVISPKKNQKKGKHCYCKFYY